MAEVFGGSNTVSCDTVDHFPENRMVFQYFNIGKGQALSPWATLAVPNASKPFWVVIADPVFTALVLPGIGDGSNIDINTDGSSFTTASTATSSLFLGFAT